MGPTLHEGLLSFFVWVIRGSFMAGILILLVLVMQFLLKNKLEARWKYLIWLPVAIRLLLPWAPESTLSLYNVLSLEAIAPGIHQKTQDPSVWIEAVKAREDAVHGERYLKPETSGNSEVPASSHESGTVQERGFWWNKIKQLGFTNGLMLVWLAGVLFLATKTVYDQLRLKQALSAGRSIETPFLSAVFDKTKQLLGVKRQVRFVASERIPGPAVVSFRKPAIVISPSLLVTLQKEQLQYILAHEFAHIQRRDVAVNWVIHIILILHWFNPLIWLAARKARQDQEMACDACVLDRMGPEQNRAYGQTIIQVLEHFSGSHHQPGLAGLSVTHKEMKRRLMMIKHFNKKSYRLSILGFGMILALGSVTLVNAKESNAASVPQTASVQAEQDSKAAEVVQEQQPEKKKIQLDQTVAAKLQKVLKQVAGNEVKLQDVGEFSYDALDTEFAEIESVDGKFGISFDTKDVKYITVSEKLPLDKISKKDQDKALQELKKLYPNITYAFDKEVIMYRYYDDKNAKLGDTVTYAVTGKNFTVQLSNDFSQNKTDLRVSKIVMEFDDTNEIEPKDLKTAEEVMKTFLNQDTNFKGAILSEVKWDEQSKNYHFLNYYTTKKGTLVEETVIRPTLAN